MKSNLLFWNYSHLNGIRLKVVLEGVEVDRREIERLWEPWAWLCKHILGDTDGSGL